MQYPIIDNFINAYANNNWSGLNSIITLTNSIEQGSISSTGQDTSAGTRCRSGFIQVKSGIQYYIEVNPNIRIYEIHEYRTDDSDTFIQYTTINDSSTTFTPSSTTGYIKILFRYGNNAAITPSDFSVCFIRINNNDTIKMEITSILKLPLPHYFPHPVIDALQQAAAGTQTSDDTEILRHYLTPLGIGGI